MIKLNFQIKVYKDNKDDYVVYEISKEYKESLTLNDIKKDLYEYYSRKHDDNICIGIARRDLFDIKYKFEDLYLDDSMYDYEDIPIGQLEEQFGISSIVFEAWLDNAVGGTVGEYRGIVFFFHTNEKDLHHIPHIHCKQGDEEFRVNLITLEEIDRGFKNKKQMKRTLECLSLNQEQLLNYWNEVVLNGETLKFKMYVPYNL